MTTTEQRRRQEQSEQADYSTRVSDIRDAVTLKYNQVFLLTNTAGDIRLQDRGCGLYFRDMCYLDQLELRMQSEPGTPLLADASADSEAVYELTNPDLRLADGRLLTKQRIGVRRTISLQERLTQTIEVHNRDQEPVVFDLEIHFACQFANIFMVRGMAPGQRGKLRQAHLRHSQVTLTYDGADGHTRMTTLSFAPAPDDLDDAHAHYQLSLAPGEQVNVTLGFTLEDSDRGAADYEAGKQTDRSGGHRHAAFAQELAQEPQIETSNLLFDRALARSLEDIRMLATANGPDLYIAAGVPWYVALFGRDSLITAFETLAYHPTLARSTLRLLAQYQGVRHNRFQDEEPGKILHELRVGEQANLREIPMIPYYGTVDATPWFLILLAEYIRWTGDLDLFTELHDNVTRALRWMDANEADKDDLPGYLSYGVRSERGFANHGWKDSDNGVVNSDGSLCKPPIALVEAQGYAYLARRALAQLFERTGERSHASRLEREAEALKQRFNDDFWLGGEIGYAFCLQRDLRPSRAVVSNPGQTLFTGITPPERAQAVAERLMRDDLFCGWGVRTLASSERAYNPLDYQVGSVWPHDNALIALGLRRCGQGEAMERIFSGVFQAATHCKEFRLPEVFDGYSQSRYARPVPYPVACSPQAWAAGALPLLLQTALGLEPDALNGRLRIHQPRLPEWLRVVTWRGLRVGDATADVQYRREGDTTLVAVLERQGDLEAIVEY